MEQDDLIPAYALFGQAATLAEPRFFHVERIGDRWKLHAGKVGEHRHPHLHQMTLWIAGTGRYVADEAVSEVAAATFCWMPAGVVHGFRVDAGSEAIVLSMSDDFGREQLAELAGIAGNGLFRDQLILRVKEDEAQGWLRQLFDRMEREYASGLPGQAECIGSLACLALTEILRLTRGGAASGGAGSMEPSLLARFLALVEARLGQRPGVEELARDLGSTPYLLNCACHVGLGMRASEVVRARHMQEAKRLLLFTALSVSEIAALTGYPDPAHFTRSFRALTGQSPRVWRAERMSSIPDRG